MSYEPTIWKDGDLVTSAKLNKLEQGVASASGSGDGGILIVHVDENYTLDRTWQEIHNADLCILKNNYTYSNSWRKIDQTFYEEELQTYTVFSDNGDEYSTNTPDGYPSGDAPK